jgi:hypothetical protein
MRTEDTDRDAITRAPVYEDHGGPVGGGPVDGGEVDGGEVDGDDAATAARADGVPRPSRLPWIVACVATAVSIAAIVAAMVLVQQARDDGRELGAVESAAGQFAIELTTWDATDGMGDTREALREAGTATFAGDVDQLFGGTDDLATLEEIGARSVGEVEDVLVQRIDGDRAEALAVVVQEVVTDITEGSEVSLRYARLGLLREDGAWRIDAVELVVDALQEAAQRTDVAPPAGDAEAPADAPQGADGEDAG